MLPFLVPVLFTFYVQDVLKLKKKSGAKGLMGEYETDYMLQMDRTPGRRKKLEKMERRWSLRTGLIVYAMTIRLRIRIIFLWTGEKGSFGQYLIVPLRKEMDLICF